MRVDLFPAGGNGPESKRKVVERLPSCRIQDMSMLDLL